MQYCPPVNKTLSITLFIAFANAISFTILIPVLFLYGIEFGLSVFHTSLLFSVYATAQFFATPVIGKLSDRYGRKPLLIISLAGTVIANALAFGAGFGPEKLIPLLFFARFLDGITGGNISVIQAVIADITTPQDRAKAFGLFGAVSFGLGFTLGPALSLIAQQYPIGGSKYGGGFLISSLIALIALVLTVVMLPETGDRAAQPPGKLFDLGLGNLISGLRMPHLGILFIINFLIGTTFTIFTFGFQPYFLKVLGQTNQSLTTLFILFGIIGVLVQVKGLSLLNQRLSLAKILFLGLLLRGITFILMPAFPNVTYFIVISIIFSIFNALVQPTMTTLISLNAKAAEQGTALGINASYLNVSNAFGPLIAGAIVNPNQLDSYGYPLILAGVLTLSVMGFAIYKRSSYRIARSVPS
jgi:MFS family permease